MKFPKKINKKHKIAGFALSLLAIFVVLVLGSIYYQNQKKQEHSRWCSNNLVQQQIAFDSRNWQQTKQLGESQYENCDQDTDNSAKVTLNYNLAAANYSLNNKDAAKSYAIKGLDINNRLSIEDRAKIKDQYSKISGMSDMQGGVYYRAAPSTDIDNGASR